MLGGPAAAKNLVLFAEDVLRGYRVDVQPLPGGVPEQWQSLCRRQGSYRFVGTAQTVSGPTEDEGYVKGASTTSTANPASSTSVHTETDRVQVTNDARPEVGTQSAPLPYYATGPWCGNW